MQGQDRSTKLSCPRPLAGVRKEEEDPCNPSVACADEAAEGAETKGRTRGATFRSGVNSSAESTPSPETLMVQPHPLWTFPARTPSRKLYLCTNEHSYQSQDPLVPAVATIFSSAKGAQFRPYLCGWVQVKVHTSTSWTRQASRCASFHRTGGDRDTTTASFRRKIGSWAARRDAHTTDYIIHPG